MKLSFDFLKKYKYNNYDLFINFFGKKNNIT